MGRGNWQGRSVEPGLYLRRQLAALIDVSPDTVRRWQEEGFLIPVQRHPGSRGHYLFDDSAVDVGKRLKDLSHMNLESRRQAIESEFGSEDDDHEEAS